MGNIGFIYALDYRQYVVVRTRTDGALKMGAGNINYQSLKALKILDQIKKKGLIEIFIN